MARRRKQKKVSGIGTLIIAAFSFLQASQTVRERREKERYKLRRDILADENRRASLALKRQRLEMNKRAERRREELHTLKVKKMSQPKQVTPAAQENSLAFLSANGINIKENEVLVCPNGDYYDFSGKRDGNCPKCGAYMVRQHNDPYLPN